jgi:hypothetical protein
VVESGGGSGHEDEPTPAAALRERSRAWARASSREMRLNVGLLASCQPGMGVVKNAAPRGSSAAACANPDCEGGLTLIGEEIIRDRIFEPPRRPVVATGDDFSGVGAYEAIDVSGVSEWAVCETVKVDMRERSEWENVLADSDIPNSVGRIEIGELGKGAGVGNATTSSGLA